jgi:hypothetical protein
VNHRNIRLKLTGRPEPAWVESATPALPPWLVSGAAARLEFACFGPGSSGALLIPTGLSLITLEIYKRRTGGTAIIAPGVFAGSLNTGLTENQWNSNSPDGSEHFAFDLTGAQTSVNAAIDSEAGSLDAWMEVYATLAGERVSLGSGPLRIYRSAAGGSPPEDGQQYYTTAQVDAILAAAVEDLETALALQQDQINALMSPNIIPNQTADKTLLAVNYTDRVDNLEFRQITPDITLTLEPPTDGSRKVMYFSHTGSASVKLWPSGLTDGVTLTPGLMAEAHHWDLGTGSWRPGP